MKKRRFSRQLQQEQISRQQLSECFISFGWIPVSPVDLGEDFIINVYVDGQATGISFYVQEKSVTNIEQRIKKNILTYSFKVSDLVHWEGFSLPVLLIVWDINSRKGNWVFVRDAFAELDLKGARWRTQSTTRVHIPLTNTTDDKGLNNMKRAIGQKVYPLIAMGNELQMRMTLAFPETDEGREEQHAFQRYIKEGEPVTLKGRIIKSLEFSDWWERWFGGYDPDKIEVHLGSISSSEVRPVSLTIVGKNGISANISGIELLPIRVGTELIRLNNDHQKYPLAMQLSVRFVEGRIQGNIKFSIKTMGSNVRETCNLLNFYNLVACGGKLRIDFLDSNIQPLSIDVEPQPSIAPNVSFMELVNKLLLIQEKTSVFFKVPEVGISPHDASDIKELYEIYTRGLTTIVGRSFTIEGKGKALKLMLDVHRQGKPVHFKLTTSDSYFEIFQNVIPTGPMIREVTGYIGISVDELDAACKKLSPEDFLPVKLINTTVIDSYFQLQANV